MDTLTEQDQTTKTIIGLMIFAGLFSLIGNELSAGSKSKTSAGTGQITEGGKIIIGTVMATAFLTLIAHAGEAGYKFATGLAAVTAVTSMLVFGEPVWKTLGERIGTGPTAQTYSTGQSGTPATVSTSTETTEAATVGTLAV
jgi:hypothetical protein